MTKLLTENLFLLEFLVDDLQMNARCDCQTPPGEICVTFQFLDNAPLEICESDFCPKKKGIEADSTKSGKSCLFSMTPKKIEEALNEFGVLISVCKKMQPGWAPDKINIANADISIANLFRELVNCVETNQGKTPTAKTLKDEFELFDEIGCKIGKISLYIRMSCFGKLIVTQFQMNLEDKTVLFKDKEGQSLYRYKKAKKKGGQGGGIPCAPTCPKTPCTPGSPLTPNVMGANNMFRGMPPGGNIGNPNLIMSSPGMMGPTPPPGMRMMGNPLLSMPPGMPNSGMSNFCPPTCMGQTGQRNNDPVMFNGRMGGGGGVNRSCIDDNTLLAMTMANRYPFPPVPPPLASLPPLRAFDGLRMAAGLCNPNSYLPSGENNIPSGTDYDMFQSNSGCPCAECGQMPSTKQMYMSPDFNVASAPYFDVQSNPSTPCKPQVGNISDNVTNNESDEEYHEFGATLGVNTLTIRLIKNKAPPAECAVDESQNKITCTE